MSIKKNPFETYDRIRDRLSAEHGYITTRTGWFLTTQILLLAILKWSFSGNHEMDKFYVQAISLLAFAISLVSILSIYAAIKTVMLLLDKESKLMEENRDNPCLSYLNLERSRFVRRGSVWVTLVLPAAFLVFWVVMLIYPPNMSYIRS